MIGRRVALAVGVLALGAVPAVRAGTSSSSAPPSAATFFVKPVLDCVVKNGGTYTAWFGYTNSKSSAITINYGLFNFFKPLPTPRPGQPKVFEPGQHKFVFGASFTSGSVTWFLNGWPATGKTSSPVCSKPQITTTSLPGGTVGAPYSAVVEATGGIEPRTFTASGLPDGLMIAPDGTISGTPTAPGSFTVQVTVTDKIGQTASKVLTIEIEGVLLQCEEGSNSTSAGGEGTPDGTLTLGLTECEPVSVILRSTKDGDTQQVDLVKEESGNTFTLDITWEPEDRQYPLPPTEIDYDGDGPGLAQPVQWCLSGPELPSDQDWCLVEHNAKVVSGDQVQVTESYFGQNDPSWTRR